MTGGEVERITDPATIRNIDWSDHYETTTPRGAPMFDAAQDLSEREADANALEAYRALVAKLEGDVSTLAQAIWDARKELGFDNDGDETPRATLGGIGVAGYAALHVSEAQEVRRDWEAGSDEYEADRDERRADVVRLNARLEQAEARVDQLTDLLTLRTEALNRTGAHNDRLRATIARVEKVATAFEGLAGMADAPARALLSAAAGDLRAALGES